MTGSVEAVREATGRAASTLGWSQQGADVEARTATLHLEPRAGVLQITAPRSSMGEGNLFAATTRLELDARKGTVLTPRLLPLAVAFDVLLPLAGTLYLGPNDPVATAFGTPFGLELLLRGVMDLLAVEFVWLSQSAAGSDLSRGVFIGGAIFMAVFNRVLSVITDGKLISARNDFAQRAVPLPSSDEVTEVMQR
jgi:hypothetical protein